MTKAIHDILIRGSIRKPALRFAFADSTSLCRDGIKLHDADPVGAAVLAEALTTGALLAVLLEGEEKYSLRYDYTGALGTILVEAKADAAIRCSVRNPHLAETRGNPDEVFGAADARLSFVKSAEGKILNSGSVQCGMASVAADTAMFFALSDQIETEIETRVRFRPDPADPVEAAAGVMLQAMPGCDLEEFAAIREKLHTPAFRKLLLEELEPERKLRALLEAAGCGGDVSLEPAGIPAYRCPCGRETARRALLTLGAAELQSLFEENPAPSTRCGFCNQTYTFTKEDFPS